MGGKLSDEAMKKSFQLIKKFFASISPFFSGEMKNSDFPCIQSEL